MKTAFIIVLSLAVVAACATPARAQVFLSGTVGAAASGLVTTTAPTYGGQLGYWFDGFLGFEGDYAYSAKTRGGGIGDNERTVMIDILAGPRLSDGDWRPYAAVGIGLIGPVAVFSDVFSAHGANGTSQLGMNAGGGIMRFFNPHWGIRVDARYLLNLKRQEGESARQHFFRAGAGLAVRF